MTERGVVRERHVQQIAGIANVDPAVVDHYFATVSREDLGERTPDELADILVAHLAVGSRREVNTPLVVVSTDGIIDLVTDDMPFLVDSVTGALVHSGHELSLLIHPQFAARRDDEGNLVQLAEPVEDSAGVNDESWMHIELEPLDSSSVDELASQLFTVLTDVQLAVNDWSQMRERATDLANELRRTTPVGVDPHEVADATELLDWLADNNFTFVGYREYSLDQHGNEYSLVGEPTSALGVMRDDHRESTSFAKLSPEARKIALEPHLLVQTKANRRSTVHRPVYLDYVGVKRFNDRGDVIGEHRFLGLYAATTYSQSVTEVPVARRKVEQVIERSGFAADSHDGRDLVQFLETYPRDEMFEVQVDQLCEFAEAVVHLQERRQTKLLLRYDTFGRFASALVYLPRDRYTTSVREQMQHILAEAFDAESVDFTARVTESVLARLHFLVRVKPGQPLPHVDEVELGLRLADAAKSWEDHLHELALNADDPVSAERVVRQFSDAFPESYKEDYPPSAAFDDVNRLLALTPDSPMSVLLYLPVDEESAATGADLRLKVYRIGNSMSLSEMLPVLQNLGVAVVDERPYLIRTEALGQGWIYDFGITLPKGDIPARDSLAFRFEQAFVKSWQESLDSDGYAALVVTAGLTWREVALVQTLMSYGRQLGTTFSQRYCEQVLVTHGALVRDIVDVFNVRLDPDRTEPFVNRDEMSSRLVRDIEVRLDAIKSLDEDRIVRSLLTLVLAVLRTNYFQLTADGQAPTVISLKVDPRAIPEAPAPRPAYEIWVHSPRLSGVHLRFGKVARGGLRWSDRREDFRTEVLGLVKAQMVKNAVIVPVGAKGGFVCLRPIDATNREAWLAEGIACYTLFVSALLDITDNLIEGTVLPPERVVRLDSDDTYLVVAADKGTATFSDIANEIAAAHNFWLGDAFASGGSAGYDHKSMGITARGAWESVKRHFRELNVDVQTEDFTVVGVGDMSGDVFGNGMLLSEHIRLVAAFDHRDIFLDPDPDSQASFVERRRLFGLSRSSWADYDRSLISAGGGVFSRESKSIDISPQVRGRLGLADDVVSLTPAELMRAILQAPVDLFWNGGIGTYVKSSAESNLDVGDKANDSIRVNGNELQCQVVGEGGNLGLTQLGRIEAAHSGVRLNTDAIDNSAGVDTSDHEVNIKILLDAAVRDGSLAVEDRSELLESMTDEVARLVLEDNYDQNMLLAVDRAQAPDLTSVYVRMMRDLEHRGELNRALEFLPSDAELDHRMSLHQGLSSPELAVLMANVKIALTSDLLPNQISAEPWFARLLRQYFPGAIVARFGDRLTSHPLANEIVTTMMSNAMVNHGGITYAFRVAEETGASAVELARAYLVATEVFGLNDLWLRIDGLDDIAPTAIQIELMLESRRLLDRATRWVLQTRGRTVDVDADIDLFRDEVSRVGKLVPDLLRGGEANRLATHVGSLVAQGAPESLARDVASLLDVFSLLDIVEIARRGGEDPVRVADLYFAVSERFGGDVLLHRISSLSRADRWSALARAALRSDLYTALAALTSRISRATENDADPIERINDWEASQTEGVARAQSTLAEITTLDSGDIATISVALRAIRALIAQGGTPIS